MKSNELTPASQQVEAEMELETRQPEVTAEHKEGRLSEEAHTLPIEQPPAGEEAFSLGEAAASSREEEVPLAEVEPVGSDEEERGRYWHSVLTGNPDTVPDEVWQRSGAADGSLSREQQVYKLCSTINRSWVADHSGLSRRELMAEWKKHRSDLARELGVGDDEQEVFVALSERETEAPRRELARKVYELAWRDGLEGKTDYDVRSLTATCRADESQRAEALALKAYSEGRSQREAALPLAQQLADGYDVFAAVEEDVFSAPRVLSGAPGLVMAVDALAELPEEERRLVVYLAAGLDRQARQQRGESPDEEGLLSRTVRAVRRGATSMGFGAFQALNHAGIATMSNLGRWVGGESGQELQQGARDWDKRMQMLNEIRHLSQQEVFPLLPEGAGRAETYLIEGAQATPAAVLSCCGGAGFAALSLSGMGESVAEARRRAPQGEQEVQLAAGVVGGAVQGAIYMGMSRIGGRMFEQTVSNFMRARGSNILHYSLAGLKSAAGMTAEGVKLMLAGKAAAAADLGAHELAARATETASNIDWKSFGDNLTDIEMNMREAAATLPFLLIGAGRMALRHFRSSNSVLGSGRRLLEWGVDEQKLNELLREPDIDVKNNMLREAICESELWSNRRYSMDIWRAMQLLNTDGKPLFRDGEVVRDFLKLPPSFDVAVAGKSSSRLPANFRKGLLLRDEWEQRAGLDYERSELAELKRDRGRGNRGLLNGKGAYAYSYMFSYENPVKNNERLHNTGLFQPGAEVERRRILRDFTERLHRSSYRLLLQFYSQDAMAHANDKQLSETNNKAEALRQEYLELVARSVLDIAGGAMREKVFDNMAQHFGEWLRKQRGTPDKPAAEAPEWMHRVPESYLNNIVRYSRAYDHSRMADYQELRDYFILLKDARVGVDVLADVLPMSDDFQTMLAQGYSPLQTFAHFLKRELGTSAGIVNGKITPKAEQKEMEAYRLRNEQRAEVYRQMTGVAAEQVEGGDGRHYFRFMRPDGSYTRWHVNQQMALSDLAANADLAFQPLGAAAHRFWLESGELPAAITRLPLAGPEEFSGYDQLCMAALRDLGYSWMEDASHTLPGLQRRKLHRIQAAARLGEELNPIVEKGEGDNQYVADRLTSLTPLGLAQSRFHAYWLQQINSGMLPFEHAGRYLVSRGAIDEPRLEAIRKIGEALPYPRRSNVPLRETPPPDIEGMHSALAKELGKFTTLYFLARMSELDVPDTVRAWYAGAAFAPEYENAMELQTSEDGKLRYVATRRTAQTIRWANRRTALRLHQIAPEVERFREQYRNGVDDELIARLLPGALAQDEVLRMEQSWAHANNPQLAFSSTGPEHWNLLRFPSEGWKLLSPDAREAYSRAMQPLLELYPGLPVSEGQDILEAAINNLTDVLKLYPELHRYSLRNAQDGYADVLTLQGIRSFPSLSYQIVNEYQPGEIRADYLVEKEPLPQSMQNSPRVRHAVYTLDLLRGYPGGLPGTMDYGIVWKNEMFGGEDGKKPVGLERAQTQRCLKGLESLLIAVVATGYGTERSSYEICGTSIPILALNELRPHTLEKITLYQHPAEKKSLYRLMPGISGGRDEQRRLPYVVGVGHRGYITSRGTFAGNITNEVCTPLHRFSRTWRSVKEAVPNSEVLRWEEVVKSLERVFVLADRAAARPDAFSAETSDLPELMMRLFEDTGFSHRLEELQLDELNSDSVRALALAAHMHSCLAALEDGSPSYIQASFNELRSYANQLSKNPANMWRLADMLIDGKPNGEQPAQNPVIYEIVARNREAIVPDKVQEIRKLLAKNGIDLPGNFAPDGELLEEVFNRIPSTGEETTPSAAEPVEQLAKQRPSSMATLVAEMLGIVPSNRADISLMAQQAEQQATRYNAMNQQKASSNGGKQPAEKDGRDRHRSRITFGRALNRTQMQEPKKQSNQKKKHD